MVYGKSIAGADGSGEWARRFSAAATARRVVRLSDGKIISDKQQEVDWE